MYRFPIEIVIDGKGNFLALCPTFPEVSVIGKTREDAIRRIRNAIEDAITARLSAWSDVPIPKFTDRAVTMATASLSTLSSLKILLFLACKESGVTRAELANRLGWHREQVRRLFLLDHASRLDVIDEAFAALGKYLEFKTVERPI